MIKGYIPSLKLPNKKNKKRNKQAISRSSVFSGCSNWNKGETSVNILLLNAKYMKMKVHECPIYNGNGNKLSLAFICMYSYNTSMEPQKSSNPCVKFDYMTKGKLGPATLRCLPHS